MDSVWRTAVWKQFGAAIDTLDNALVVCPDALWQEHLWTDDPPLFGEFWYSTYHALVSLDQYLSVVREEEFAPPAPFTEGEGPGRPYTKEELRAYLASMRAKCCTTLIALTDEVARQPYKLPWVEGPTISILELLILTMRHVQEHAAHLSVFLGQQGRSGEALDSVARARDDPGSHVVLVP